MSRGSKKKRRTCATCEAAHRICLSGGPAATVDLVMAAIVQERKAKEAAEAKAASLQSDLDAAHQREADLAEFVFCDSGMADPGTNDLKAAVAAMARQRADAVRDLSFARAALDGAREAIGPDDVQWIVNDNAELGVMVRGRAFFLYKARSLEYECGKHGDGTPMMYRPVGRGEFGESCYPPRMELIPDRYTVPLQVWKLDDGNPRLIDLPNGGWMPLPVSSTAEAKQPPASDPYELYEDPDSGELRYRRAAEAQPKAVRVLFGDCGRARCRAVSRQVNHDFCESCCRALKAQFPEVGVDLANQADRSVVSVASSPAPCHISGSAEQVMASVGAALLRITAAERKAKEKAEAEVVSLRLQVGRLRAVRDLAAEYYASKDFGKGVALDAALRAAGSGG